MPDKENSGLKAKRLAALKNKPAPAPYSPPVPNPTGRRYALKPGLVIDLSGYEPGLQIVKMNPGPVAVYCRASLGTWYTDPMFAYYRDQCRDLDIPYFGYHFPQFKWQRPEVGKQVDRFLKATDGFEWSEKQPPVLDAEYAPGVWPTGYRGKNLADLYMQWLAPVEAATGVIPWIYTNQNFWWYTAFDPTGKKDKNNFQAPTWTKHYPCIVAWYPDHPDLWAAPSKYVLPAGFTDFRIWQYAEDGRSNGYPANDLNVMLK